MRVFVYFNLHRKCWSIKALEGENKGRVIGHAKALYLYEVTAKVSEAGRQRVLKERKKNVHAGLVGNLLCVSKDSQLWDQFPYYGEAYNLSDSSRITYNPYRFETFVSVDNPDWAVKKATLALLLGDRSVNCWGLETYSLTESKQLDLFAA
jgi:hypothetical protein